MSPAHAHERKFVMASGALKDLDLVIVVDEDINIRDPLDVAPVANVSNATAISLPPSHAPWPPTARRLPSCASIQTN